MYLDFSDVCSQNYQTYRSVIFSNAFIKLPTIPTLIYYSSYDVKNFEALVMKFIVRISFTFGRIRRHTSFTYQYFDNFLPSIKMYRIPAETIFIHIRRNKIRCKCGRNFGKHIYEKYPSEVCFPITILQCTCVVVVKNVYLYIPSQHVISFT